MGASRLSKFMTVIATGSEVAQTILQQLGGQSKLSSMTGAKDFVYGKNWLKFTIGKNASKANRVQIVYNSGSDSYDLILLTYSKAKLAETTFSSDKRLDVEGLRTAFTQRTGLRLSLGTTKSTARPAAPAPRPAPAPASDSSEKEKMKKFVDGLSAEQRRVLLELLTEAPTPKQSVRQIEKLPANASAVVRKIRGLTDINNHTGAAIELAKFLKESTLLDDLNKIKARSTQGTRPQDVKTRDTMIVPMLLDVVKRRFGDGAYNVFRGVF